MSNEDIPLYPYPDGWYVIEAGDRLQKEQVIQKTWMGQEIVAWRDEAGSVCVAGAFCPHLGAHLGPDSGGLVRRECLVCPFHGFEFDVSGQCRCNTPRSTAAAGPSEILPRTGSQWIRLCLLGSSRPSTHVAYP